MKFLVDSLPYYGDFCPFANNQQCNTDQFNIEKCPRSWDKYFICSDDNPRECEHLKEIESLKVNINYEV